MNVIPRRLKVEDHQTKAKMTTKKSKADPISRAEPLREELRC